MKRSRLFDPREYLEWRPDPALVAEYARRIEADPERGRTVAALSRDDLLRLYRDLLLTRLHDIALKRWVRTGVISKAWLGTGEEAVTVGCSAALDPGRDLALPMIRNAGALHMMGMPLADMFRGYLATPDSPTGGRDLHIGRTSAEGAGVLQPISHMGTSATVAAGAAIAFRKRGRVALTWIGDGAARTAAAHEGLVVAAALGVPAVFVIQNNQVALGTRLDQHTAGDLNALPEVYGLPRRTCDGNNVLDVYAAAKQAVDLCRAGEGPAVLVADTFRMGGHATHDEAEARATFDDALFTAWGKRDPIGLYEEHLKGLGLTADELKATEEQAEGDIEAAAAEALTSRELEHDPRRAWYEGITEGGVLHGLDLRPS